MSERIGFGCADLMRLPSRAERRRLLDAAYDAGIRHFDVAPMYGLGRAEREVGRFARGRRDELLLATKFGVEPTAAARLLAPVQAQLQKRGGRREGDPRAGRVGRLLYAAPGYTAEAARASLDRSLSALGTDRVDFFFLHDPPQETTVGEELRAYLDTEPRIGTWGVAGRWAGSVGGSAPAVQVPGDYWSRAAPRPGQTTIFYGVVRQGLPRLQQLDADSAARLLVHEALAANPAGKVLVGTTVPERLARLTTPPDNLHELRSLLA